MTARSFAGSLGPVAFARSLWKSLEEVFPGTCHQRCWFHSEGMTATGSKDARTANVLNHFPTSIQPAATANLREILHADTRAAALAAIEVFKQKYGARYARGVACLTKDTEALLASGDVKETSLERVAVDTTVMERKITHPADARPYERGRATLVALAREAGVPLRQR